MNKATDKKKVKADDDEKKRCPLDVMLACTDCRLYQVFLGTDADRICTFVRIAQRMPL